MKPDHPADPFPRDRVLLHREEAMKAADATVEVFVTAFEALPRPEREAVLRRLFVDPAFKEDLLDVAPNPFHCREDSLGKNSGIY
jgi:hypothetical protein